MAFRMKALWKKNLKHLPVNKRNIGQEKEHEALQYLEQQGFGLIESNYFCRVGEIDLIVEDKDTYVFVEVRYRKNTSYGGAAISITPHKQTKLIKAAEHYIQAHPHVLCKNCRFDVIAITGQQIEWIKNAIER